MSFRSWLAMFGMAEHSSSFDPYGYSTRGDGSLHLLSRPSVPTRRETHVGLLAAEGMHSLVWGGEYHW